MAAPTIIPKSSYYDGPVTESDRANGRAGAPDFTVYGPEDLKLSAHPTIPFALVVKKGKAAAYGVTALVQTAAGGDLTVQCDSQTSGTRWDIITIRYDWRPELGGPSDIRAINAGGKQVPTGLQNTPGTLVDQPTWLVRWTGSSSTPAEYIDLRCFASNGGMMANDVIALQYLKKLGATVRVGSNLWVYQETANQQLDWVAYPLQQQPLRMVEIPVNGVSNSNAEVDTNFTPFPNSAVWVGFTDQTFGETIDRDYREVELINGRVRWRLYRGDTGGKYPGAGFTVNIVVLGY